MAAPAPARLRIGVDIHSLLITSGPSSGLARVDKHLATSIAVVDGENRSLGQVGGNSYDRTSGS